MKQDKKQAWLKKATNRELLDQLYYLRNNNSYGVYDNDIKITTQEILERMGEKQ